MYEIRLVRVPYIVFLFIVCVSVNAVDRACMCALVCVLLRAKFNDTHLCFCRFQDFFLLLPVRFIWSTSQRVYLTGFERMETCVGLILYFILTKFKAVCLYFQWVNVFPF